MMKFVENIKPQDCPQSKHGISPQRLAEIKLKIARKHYFSKEILLKVAEKILDDL